jgi:gamma-glutamyltranspeptidase/glutathione hydrolase
MNCKSDRKFTIAGPLLCAASILAGCATNSGTAGSSAAGYVVGDEPNAVHAGASVLGVGGSAADAATAMYFALSVTYPVAAGLGGGGVCVVRDRNGAAESIDFPATDPIGKGAFAVPGNVRGFAALQGAYGRLPWQRDVADAEELATAGFPISASLAARAAAAQDVIRLDASLAAEFFDESGHVKPAGSPASNRDLGRTLSLIRAEGSRGFYRDVMAAKITAYAASQNNAIGADELSAYLASRTPATRVSLGEAAAYLPSGAAGAGRFAAALLSTVQSMTGQSSQDAVAPNVALAASQTLDKLGVKSLPADLGSAGFAAVDNAGQAVACAVTMNGPFGSGRTVESTGVTLARAPSSAQPGLAGAFLTPAILVRGDSLVLAGAGSGGPNGTASMVYSLLRSASGGASADVVRTTGVAPFDTVNVILCQSNSCSAVPDPAANGLGKSVGK